MSEMQEGKRRLQPIQERAIDILLTGASITDTAKELNVARQTVSDWLNHGESFREAYDERRLRTREAITNRLLSLGPKAVQALERELDGSKSVQAAAVIMRSAESYADGDLQTAKFQQMMHSYVIEDLLKAVTQMSKMNDKTFVNVMRECGGSEYFEKTGGTSAEAKPPSASNNEEVLKKSNKKQ